MKSTLARIVLIFLVGIPALTFALTFVYMAGWWFSLLAFGIIGYAAALMWAVDNL